MAGHPMTFRCEWSSPQSTQAIEHPGHVLTFLYPGGPKAAFGSAVACGILLGVFEGVGVVFGRVFAQKPELPPCTLWLPDHLSLANVPASSTRLPCTCTLMIGPSPPYLSYTLILPTPSMDNNDVAVNCFLSVLLVTHTAPAFTYNALPSVYIILAPPISPPLAFIPSPACLEIHYRTRIQSSCTARREAIPD